MTLHKTFNPLIAEEDMPVPRLELRWENSTGDWCNAECTYALVLPLRENDLRGQDESEKYVRNTVTIPFNTSGSEGSKAGDSHPIHQLTKDPYILPPFRDLSHAMWDSISLGNIPIYVVGDGKAQLVVNEAVPAPQAVLK